MDMVSYQSFLFSGGHRSVIMSVGNGKVLLLLVKLIRNGTEKVLIMFLSYVLIHVLSAGSMPSLSSSPKSGIRWC